ncbi:hypothetical protein GCM10025734_77260 [Kitasatospora paranensis]
MRTTPPNPAAPAPGGTARRTAAAAGRTGAEAAQAVHPDAAGERHTAPGASRLLRRVLVRTRGWAAVLAGTVAVSTAAALALPAVLADAVDRVLRGQGTGWVPLLGVLCVLTAAETVGQYAGPRAAADATVHLRQETIRRVVAAGPYPAVRFAPGDLVARLTGSAPEAALAAQAVVYSAAQLALALGAVTALAVLALPLAAAFLATAPAGFVLVRRYLRRAGRLGAGYQRVQADLATRLLDALGGSRSIAASATLEQEIERVLAPVPELARHGRRLWDSQRRIAWATGLLAPATQLTVLAVAGYELSAGALTVGGLLAALGYTGIGLSGFGTAQSLLDLARARAGAGRVAEVLDLPVRAPGTVPLPPGAGLLELRG